jgi:hypothetical protein
MGYYHAILDLPEKENGIVQSNNQRELKKLAG